MWTDERVEELKKLWAGGTSAMLIAMTLGGVTRNAVIGKVHRLGLSGRATTERGRNMRRKPTKTLRPVALKPKSVELFTVVPLPTSDDSAIPLAQRVAHADLEPHHCRWPIGDPKEPEFAFCGGQKIEGLSYCECHARRAYEPPRPKRREIKNYMQFEVVA